MSNHILYVDSSPTRRQRLSSYLTGAEYEIQSVDGIDGVLHSTLTDPPVLLLWDIDLDEPLQLRRLRERYSIPLVLVGSPDRPEDEIIGLRRGADHVITGLDNVELVLARVSAAVRRSGLSAGDEAELIHLDDLVIDTPARRVTVDGEPVELSEREFLLLWTLAREAGVVLSREELLDRVWGPDFVGEPQTLTVYISWLRKKLSCHSEEANRIVTVHGLGYKLMRSEGE